MKYIITELDNGFIVKSDNRIVVFEGEPPEHLKGNLSKRAFGKQIKKGQKDYDALRDRMLTNLLNNLIMDRRIHEHHDFKVQIEWNIKK